MASQRDIAAGRHRSMQTLLALFSILFVAIVAYGYYYLLIDFGWFIALLGGLLVSGIAWFLARVAGTGDGGLKANWVLIVPLFLVSAAGVYNSMMLYLEGGRVLADAASSAQKDFARVENAATTQLEAQGVTKKANRINSLRDALFSEIQNPLNCGQGPEARRLIAELQRQLPEFKPLSSPGKKCEQNEEVLEDYRARIATLVARAPWNDAELQSVMNDASESRTKLADLQKEISRSYSPGDVNQITGIFESLQAEYQDLLFRLGKKTNVDDMPEQLDIVGAQSLGNVSKLPALFFSRLDEVSTYVYLLFALGFDLLLVYLFQIATRNRVKKHVIDSTISGAW